MGNLEIQIITLDKEEDCKKILLEKNVGKGDILEIVPRPIYESYGLVTLVDWNAEIPIQYLSSNCSAYSNFDKTGLEFDYDSALISTALGKIHWSEEGYKEALLKFMGRVDN